MFERRPGYAGTRSPLRIGKMSLTDIFDVNDVLTDSHLQFLNWTVDNNGAWDYAADTRVYTVGGAVEYDDAFANDSHMGNYREAVQAFLDGVDPTPRITQHGHFGTVKCGFEWNGEQEITGNLRIGWNDDQEESFAYTEVGQTALLGLDYAGASWKRPSDKIGISFASNAIKKDHQNYLKYNGLGFLLGDGRLNYARENIEEGSYYNWHDWKGLFFALDGQHINNPGYNHDRGPVWVAGVRTHMDF